MMLTKEEIINRLHQNYPQLASEFGVKQIGIFGSYAKGTAGLNSDVDLVIEFEQPLGFRFVELTEYLEALLGQQVDVLTPAGIQAIRLPHVAKSIQESVIYVPTN
ncbi:MAG TPA: nucleotidyltransferase family protein [Anaerolineae bacterium]|nr:nucleotidyltransferase family protein [Anaerolineae bacterium]HMR67495.1 nucleotidyltransferase family protein [Anaerolineae bacterium]